MRTALGYALNQQAALIRVLDDGRLKLENNRSEREMRRIATGRKVWLITGSDDHGHAAAALFSLIASTQLQGLYPEACLGDVNRVLAYWPKERSFELAPKYWARTRERLVPAEPKREVGRVTVSEPLSIPAN